MNIKELLELGDKRTQGEWGAFKGGQQISLKDGGRRQVHKINQDGTQGAILALIRAEVSADCGDANQQYITAAPQMESKLREIVDILPEIKHALIGYGILLDDWNLEDATQHPDELHKKIQQWENN